MRLQACLRSVAAVVLAAALPTSFVQAAIKSDIFATGLESPAKVALTPYGNLLVSEGGIAPQVGTFVPNQGRVSVIDRYKNRRSLLEGLPSGLDLDKANASGPTALWMDGPRTLYVVIGQGDNAVRNAAGGEAPNPAGLSSALFSTLWRVDFQYFVDHTGAPFVLNATSDYQTLSDGKTLTLRNSEGLSATIQVVASLRTVYPDTAPNTVSGSNPYGLLVENGTAYMPDAGQNSLVEIPAGTGRPLTITHFPNVPNTAGFGPPVSQAVPNSLHPYGTGSALVTLFTGFPFGPGAASVRLVDLATGAQQPFITGLTTPIDVLSLASTQDAPPFLVLEYASGFNPASGFVNPGRLLEFSTPTAAPDVLSTALTTPVSMVYDYSRHELFVAEATGTVVRFTF